MKMKIVKYIGLLLITILGFVNGDILDIYKQLILNSNMVILLATLIAGLFGFIIAVIPFAIQLFNQDNLNKKNKFLNNLMSKDKFSFFVKPMFYRFIKMLKIMFYLFLYIFIIHIIQIIDINNISFLDNEFFNITVKTYAILTIFYFYIILIVNFFIMLKNIIRDLESLIFDFIQSKK